MLYDILYVIFSFSLCIYLYIHILCCVPRTLCSTWCIIWSNSLLTRWRWPLSFNFDGDGNFPLMWMELGGGHFPSISMEAATSVSCGWSWEAATSLQFQWRWSLPLNSATCIVEWKWPHPFKLKGSSHLYRSWREMDTCIEIGGKSPHPSKFKGSGNIPAPSTWKGSGQLHRN